jgi:hypothetical protein
MNSLWDIRIFLGLVPKESPCISTCSLYRGGGSLRSATLDFGCVTRLCAPAIRSFWTQLIGNTILLIKFSFLKVLKIVSFSFPPFLLSFLSLYPFFVCRGCSVGIATRYGMDVPGIESRWERDFPHPSRSVLGSTQPNIQWIPVPSQR